MIHLDLFSGIGGFSYAVDQVWKDVEHIFCEVDPFCKAVLRKHWPNAKIYENIRIFTDTDFSRLQESWTEQQANRIGQSDETTTNTESRQSGKPTEQKRWQDISGGNRRIDILTGGFPCQPFSQAGQRRGTEDNRYLWPEMFRVIQLTKPAWIVAENVYGLVNIQGGVVFEQVCSDLESEGYEVQTFIIPACAVNAPHRRDRVWIIAYNKYRGNRRGEQSKESGQEKGRYIKNAQNPVSERSGSNNAPNSSITNDFRGSGRSCSNEQWVEKGKQTREESWGESPRRDKVNWDKSWLEVATELCGVDDGLPAGLDGLKLSKAGHRRERLKSLGNAIVPQVAVEIMKAIKDTNSYL